MINFRAFYIVLPIFIFSFYSNYNANAQYLPVGPQTNVPESTVTGGGWTECYHDTYNVQMNADTVLSNCTGNLLMLACRTTGSDTLALLAQGLRSDVTFDTDSGLDSVHIANGVGWYFNNTGFGSGGGGFSWGFVRAGDSADKDNCDVDTSGANDERLCWHLQGEGGWRCGVTQGLSDSVDYERIVYTATLTARSTPIPALSEWGMISAAAGLGLIGVFFAVRKKRFAR